MRCDASEGLETEEMRGDARRMEVVFAQSTLLPRSWAGSSEELVGADRGDGVVGNHQFLCKLRCSRLRRHSPEPSIILGPPTKTEGWLFLGSSKGRLPPLNHQDLA